MIRPGKPCHYFFMRWEDTPLTVYIMAVLLISLFLNVHYYFEWQNAKKERDFYKFWNGIHTETLENLIRGERND